ncbi:MAG TPA: phage holin family protein [Thermoleophilaceae bacterium]|nr:phage holin family protein [Thermoleophilaceae bacterium]
MEQQANDNKAVGELVQDLSQQTAALVRKELQLAQIELTEKGKRAGIGAGLFGTAGVIALYAVGVFIAAAVMGLATVIEPWVAAVIVGVVMLAAAGIASLMGKKQVEQAVPPAPEQAIQSTKRDVDEVKGRAGR